MRFFKAPQDQVLDAEQMVFDSDNRAQRVLIALVLDTSSSMKGKPIALLNDALQDMSEDLRHDVELSAKAEVAIITFGDGGVLAWRGAQPAPNGTSPFVPASQLEMPRLQANGVTPMIEAVELAMRCVAEQKRALRERHISYYRPLVWLISDGIPTDAQGHYSESWRRLPDRIRREERDKRFVFFTVSAGDISPDGDAVLEALAPDAHLRLAGFEFAVVLQLVSASAESAAHDDPLEAIKRKVTEGFGQIKIDQR
jgi:uncharacterized protein YegL